MTTKSKQRGGIRPGAGRPRGTGSAVGLAAAKLEKEQALAGLRQLEWHKRRHELTEVAAVTHGIEDATAEARSALLALPDRISEQLAAESDPHRVHVLLTEQLEQVLTELAHRLLAGGK
jgi:hypothetical protein